MYRHARPRPIKRPANPKTTGRLLVISDVILSTADAIAVVIAVSIVDSNIGRIKYIPRNFYCLFLKAEKIIPIQIPKTKEVIKAYNIP